MFNLREMPQTQLLQAHAKGAMCYRWDLLTSKAIGGKVQPWFHHIAAKGSSYNYKSDHVILWLKIKIKIPHLDLQDQKIQPCLFHPLHLITILGHSSAHPMTKTNGGWRIAASYYHSVPGCTIQPLSRLWWSSSRFLKTKVCLQGKLNPTILGL